MRKRKRDRGGIKPQRPAMDLSSEDVQHKPKMEPTMPMQWLSIDLVLFTISEFLPGEYLLRVFPLICKAMKSRRLSLSLLGSSSTRTYHHSSVVPNNLEGPIYGVSSIKRDFQRIVNCGHSLTALKVDQISILKRLSFPHVETLSLSEPPPTNFPSLSTHFPRLIKLDIGAQINSPKRVVELLWNLPLVALTFNATTSYLYLEVDDSNDTKQFFRSCGPPAFSHTLRSLETWDRRVLNALSPHCRNLQTIKSGQYHAIVAEQPGLTSLVLYTVFSNVPTDMTVHTQLVELTIDGSRALEQYPELDLPLSRVGPNSASAPSFLLRCPALKHLSLYSKWEHIVEMIAVLDATQCTKLTLGCPSSAPLRDIKTLIVDRGFHVNDQFLLSAVTNDNDWRMLMEMAPHIKDCTVLKGEMIHLLCHPGFLTSFNALSAIEITTHDRWDRRKLLHIVQSCSMLKKLKIHGTEFSGALRVDSTSLCELNLRFDDGCSGFNFKLPNLTHLFLTFFQDGSALVRGLLDGDPRLELPLLRVLDILYKQGHERILPVLCKAGHRTLTQLELRSYKSVDTREALAFSTITLANLPSLRRVKLDGLPYHMKLIVDLPGQCDIELSNFCSGTRIYKREGKSTASNFRKEISFPAWKWRQELPKSEQ